jgi:hypothetical protein
MVISNRLIYVSTSSFDEKVIRHAQGNSSSISELSQFTSSFDHFAFSDIRKIFVTQTGQLFALRRYLLPAHARVEVQRADLIHEAFVHPVIGVVSRLVYAISRQIRCTTAQEIVPQADRFFSGQAASAIAARLSVQTPEIKDATLCLQTVVRVKDPTLKPKVFMWFQKGEGEHFWVLADYALEQWRFTSQVPLGALGSSPENTCFTNEEIFKYSTVDSLSFLQGPRRGCMIVQFLQSQKRTSLEVDFPCETSRKLWRRQIFDNPFSARFENTLTNDLTGVVANYYVL